MTGVEDMDGVEGSSTTILADLIVLRDRFARLVGLGSGSC